MQPPAPRYPQPTTHSSILSAALSSNISSSRSSQQLLQNLVQVSQAGQVVSVSLAADHTTSPPATSTIAAPNGHLMVQGVQGGFQLVPQVGSHGQQLQLVQQSGNGGGVQLVNSVPGQGGQRQIDRGRCPWGGRRIVELVMGRCDQALRELVNATSDHLARLFATCEEDARAGFLEGNCILVTVIADELSAKYEHVGQYPIKFLKVMCCYFGDL